MAKDTATDTVTTAAPGKPRPERVVWRVGRGRSGGTLGCAVIAHRAMIQGRSLLIGDGDVNNPTLSRMFDQKEKNAVERPKDAELETSKIWLANSLADAVARRSSIIIDMGGGDRVTESLTHQASLGEFLGASGQRATFAYFTGPERDDFEHLYRIWDSGAFEDGDAILFLNEGLARVQTRGDDPFQWLRDDPRFHAMEEKGVISVTMPALTCMKYLEDGNLTIFQALNGKPKSDGTPLNPLWRFMVEKWLKDFIMYIEKEGAGDWLP